MVNVIIGHALLADSVQAAELPEQPRRLDPGVNMATVSDLDRSAHNRSRSEPNLQVAQSASSASHKGRLQPVQVKVRAGRHFGYDRLVFDWPESVEADIAKTNDELIITFDRPADIALPAESTFTWRAKTWPQVIYGLIVDGRGQRVRVKIGPDVSLRSHSLNEDRRIVIDILHPTPGEANTTAADTDAEQRQGRGEATYGPEKDLEAAYQEAFDAQFADPADADKAFAFAEVAVRVGDLQGAIKALERIDRQDPNRLDTKLKLGELYRLQGQSDLAEAKTAESPQAKTEGIEAVVSGSVQFGVTSAEDELLSDGEGDRGYAFFMDSEIYIDADFSPSEDLKIGARVVLEADADVIGDANADQTYMYASGAFGVMELGRTSGAEDDMALGADTIAAGTGGIDGDTANLGETQIVNSDDAAKVSYFTPRIGGFQLGASYTPDTGDNEGSDDDEEDEDLEDHIGVGLNFVDTFGDVDVSLAAVGSFGNSEQADGDDLVAFSVGGTLALDNVEMGASYGQTDEAFDVDFATLGFAIYLDNASAGIGYNYVDEKSDGITHVIALSGDVVMLSGFELQGDVSYADPEQQQDNIASVLAVELTF